MNRRLISTFQHAITLLAVLFCAAPTHAQINPIIFDLSGTWRLESIFVKEQWKPEELDRCKSLFAHANFPMYGKDLIRLNFLSSERVRNSQNNYWRFYYNGVYIHHHGYASREAVLNASNQIDHWNYNYNKHIETILYNIEGYVEYNWLVNSFLLDMQGVSPQTPIYEHGVSLHIRQYVEGVTSISNLLFDSYQGDAVNLNISFSDPQYPVFGFPEGADVELGEGRPSAISASGCGVLSRYPLRFVKQSDSVDELNEKGSLSVNVFLNTVNPVPVEHASIEVRLQDFGLRERGPDESMRDYVAFADAHSTPVACQALTPESIHDGLSEIRIDGLNVFSLIDTAGGSSLAPGYYYIKVLSPSTTIAGVGETHLLENRSLNHSLLPNQLTSVNIPLEALEEIGIKREVATALSESSKVHYKPIEDRIMDHLSSMESDVSLQTPEKIEGVKRSIDAERAINDAAYWSDNMLTFLLTGFSNLAADLYGELDFTRSDISAMRARLNRSGLENRTLVSGYSESFRIPGDAPTPTLRDMAEPVFQSNDAGIIRSALSSFCTILNTELRLAGVDSGDAQKICRHVRLSLELILRAFQTRTLSGATQAYVQQLIRELVKFPHPILFDNNLDLEQWDVVSSLLDQNQSVGGEDVDPFLNFDISYCSLTNEALERSVDQAVSWSENDIQRYFTDKTRTSAVIDELNRDAVETDNQVRTELALANSFGSASDLLKFIGSVAPNTYTEFFRKLTKLLKYLSNGASTFQSFKFIYGRAPDYADNASRLAFGKTPPDWSEVRTVRPAPINSLAAVPTQQTGSIHPDFFSRLTLKSQQLVTKLGQLYTLVNNNDFGGLLEEIRADQPGSYRNVVADYRTVLDEIDTLMASADPNSPDIPDQTSFSQVPFIRLRFEQHESDMFFALRDLIASVIAPDYTGPDDPAYLAKKNQVKYLIQSVRSMMQTYTDDIFIGSFALRNIQLTPSVFIRLDNPRSVETGDSLIQHSGERFVLKAHVSNLNASPVKNITLRLRILSPHGSLLNQDEEIHLIDGLTGDDGAPLVGDDETDITWTLQYDGDFSESAVALIVSSTESNEMTVPYLTNTAQTTLFIDPIVRDSDLDGMPNAYEAEYGFKITQNDASEDADQDGLSNLEEMRLGTNPTIADTDQDGRSDGDEVFGRNGAPSNPLESDSDLDGVSDSVDGEPYDGSTAISSIVREEPQIGLGWTEIHLTEKNPDAVIPIINAGGQRLIWSAFSENESICVSSPNWPNDGGESDFLIIAAPTFYDFRSGINTETKIQVVNRFGFVKDRRTILVTVGDEQNSNPANAHPNAVEDRASTESGVAIHIDVLSNDSDPDSDKITLIGVTQPEHGVAGVNSDGTVFYRSRADFTGDDHIKYTIRDSDGNREESSVTVTVSALTKIQDWTAR
ncbi:MAG: hypothetical protein GC154_01805 [bacterium]|nr:hypothetical protein [bacterium]